MAMTARLTLFAFACVAATGVSAAELSPGSAQSVHLAGFEGVVYYTVEQDGYRVVATLASGAEQQPIRFISTLVSGQRVVISVPQSAGQPSIEFEILRNGGSLLVGEPIATEVTNPVEPMAVRAEVQE